MVKRSTVLKVVSIILIVMGVFSILGVIALFAMGDSLEQTYAMLGMEPPSMFSNIVSLVASLLFLVSGIMGVASKSKILILILGVILCVYYIINIIITTVTLGFSPLNFIGLIIPLLYMWGWYQTN